MAQFDLPLDQLREYQPRIEEPPDFDAFWEQTLTATRAATPAATPAATRAHEPAVSFEPVDTGLPGMRTWDVTFAGYDGHPIRAWFNAPAHAQGPLPLVVEYHGYSGGRSLPHCWGLWPLAGYAHFVMDVRGQGGSGDIGATGDPVGTTGPTHPGYMTRGIEHRDTYYYRRVFTDAVRAVEAARSHPLADADRTVALGRSQGGGITLAVAALVPGLRAVAVDVPFLCHFGRAVTLTDAGPYAELARYLGQHRGKEEQVLRTLAHFDGVSFAARGRVPALFSVALMDQVCPPSTVFAAYNAYAGEKRIEVYPFNEHEGGGVIHEAARLRWLAEVLGDG